MQTTGERQAGRREWLMLVGQTVVFDIGLSMLLFNVSRGYGASELQAYLCSMLGPLISIVVEFGRHRAFSPISGFVIAIQVLSAAVTFVGSTDPDVLLLKDSALTGAFGLCFLGSLVIGRPATFVLGERFATQGHPDAVAEWRALWQVPQFRRAQHMITGVWGAGYALEALIRVVCVETMDYDAAYNVGAVLPLGVTALIAAWTGLYSQRLRRRANAEPGVDEEVTTDTPATV